MKKIKGMRKTVLYQIAIEKMLTNKADRNFRVSKKPDFSEKSGFLDRRSHGKTDSIVSVQQRIGIMAETVFAATGN
ncbi:MAG: hypothetical protein R2941_15590 [Desulfobacterales bacterium]